MFNKKEYFKEYNKKRAGHTKFVMHKKRFGGLRDDVLKRDDYKCLLCGMTNQEHKALWNRSLTIDHVDGNGRYSTVPNNTLDNLQTLCLRCHGRKDSTKYWHREVGEHID